MLYESFNSICKLRSNYLDENGEPEKLDPILIQDTSYSEFSDKKISLPSDKEEWPEYKYLNKKYFG